MFLSFDVFLIVHQNVIQLVNPTSDHIQNYFLDKFPDRVDFFPALDKNFLINAKLEALFY